MLGTLRMRLEEAYMLLEKHETIKAMNCIDRLIGEADEIDRKANRFDQIEEAISSAIKGLKYE